jgi:hypothetical protein
VIRQAISCDICGAEKKQTNHWFVAYEQSGELRASGWNSRLRLRPGMKHLCGQTCLHKLMDDFMARAIAVRAHPDAEAEEMPAAAAAGEMASTAPVEGEWPARVIASPALPRIAIRAPAELVAMPGRLQSGELAAPDELPRFATRNRRSEAWARERERTLYAVERQRSRA